MEKKWILSGIICVILAIILGAFGAHGLKPLLTEEQLVSFETGAKYLMYHGILFTVVGLINRVFIIQPKAVFTLLILGIVFFSGSIFGLTLSHVSNIPALRKVLGPITPIGGLLLIIGWMVYGFNVWKKASWER